MSRVGYAFSVLFTLYDWCLVRDGLALSTAVDLLGILVLTAVRFGNLVLTVVSFSNVEEALRQRFSVGGSRPFTPVQTIVFAFVFNS